MREKKKEMKIMEERGRSRKKRKNKYDEAAIEAGRRNKPGEIAKRKKMGKKIKEKNIK